MIFPVVVVLLIILFYLTRKNYHYWQIRGIQGPRPTFFFGNFGKCFIFKQDVGTVYSEVYRKYPQQKVVGLFKSFSPVLLVRDLELIKEITIKSFNHFHDNGLVIDKKIDPILGKNPFFLKGEEWKSVRAQLTSGFTSGKMQWLYPYLQNNAQKMVRFIDSKINEKFELKSLCVRFTLNNACDTVLGIDAKCFEEENNEFRQLLKEFISPGSWAARVSFVTHICPSITNIFSFRLCPKNVQLKFIKIVTEALRYREENNVVRNDFLHVLNQVKESSKNLDFTDVDIAAHVAGFFADGADSSALVLSVLLFHLSVNPEVQSKLRQEVREAYENNDKLSFEEIQNLSYLSGVVNESLRINPPVYFSQRVCTKTFTTILEDTNESFIIEKDDSLILPIHALQNDPQYFEYPEIFKPERFIGENKKKIQKCTFMPFGEGPRACLGQRFGLLQVKVGLAAIIKIYEVSLNDKTKLPLRFEPASLLISPIGGLWINFKRV